MAMGAGALTLQSPDPMLQPRLHYNYLQEAFDRQRLRDGVRLSLQLAGHEAFRDIMHTLYQPTEADLISHDALGKWLLRNVSTMHHICGTCTLGSVSDALVM